MQATLHLVILLLAMVLESYLRLNHRWRQQLGYLRFYRGTRHLLSVPFYGAAIATAALRRRGLGARLGLRRDLERRLCRAHRRAAARSGGGVDAHHHARAIGEGLRRLEHEDGPALGPADLAGHAMTARRHAERGRRRRAIHGLREPDRQDRRALDARRAVDGPEADD